MKYLKTYEETSKNIPNFAINIVGSSDEDLMKIFDKLEQHGKLYLNGSQDKKEFISYKDQTGKAWCWIIKPKFGRWENRISISGVHTPNWYDKDNMEHIIDWKSFIKLGFEQSIEQMKKDVERIRMEKTASKYNL